MKARFLVALIGLLAAADARAEGPTEKDTLHFEGSQRLGKAGMIVGYTGPVFVFVGGVSALFGAASALNATAGSLSGEPTDPNAGVGAMKRGAVLLGIGGSMNTAGAALLSSSSVVGASAVRNSGGQVGSGAGWASVAGSGLQVLSLGFRFSSPETAGPAVAAGVVGWGTGMIAGTIQHVQNKQAWVSMGMSQRPVERKRVTLSVAPSSNGVQVFGTF